MLMQVHEIQGTLDTGFYRSRDSKAWSFDFPIDTSNSEYMAYFPYGDESYAFWAGEDMALERETYVGAEILRNRPDTCDSQQFDAVIRQDSTGRVIDGEFSIVDYNSCTKAYTPWPNDGNAVNRMNTILVTMWNLSRTPIDSARFSASDQAKGR